MCRLEVTAVKEEYVGVRGERDGLKAQLDTVRAELETVRDSVGWELKAGEGEGERDVVDGGGGEGRGVVGRERVPPHSKAEKVSCDIFMDSKSMYVAVLSQYIQTEASSADTPSSESDSGHVTEEGVWHGCGHARCEEERRRSVEEAVKGARMQWLQEREK